ncbi:hypothetical protein HNP32_001312 [Brevundimonas bullata]|uniref:Uncharacterized protein n=1 Tax=Brevundimonas bullata TaxID=13160 RepID=A0A7W7ING6_9CAUL|nr:hypothetical protein [Brevundimonas bullata]MBB4797588.1 hypothetical protein [Brevundimonas bullata]MBB6382548.1 hypothetical protein [Brevundimonas bullata]
MILSLPLGLRAARGAVAGQPPGLVLDFTAQAYVMDGRRYGVLANTPWMTSLRVILAGRSAG